MPSSAGKAWVRQDRAVGPGHVTISTHAGGCSTADAEDRPRSNAGSTSSPFIAAGYDHSGAITVAGPTLCWGLNEYGQVGDGTTANRQAPRYRRGDGATAQSG